MAWRIVSFLVELLRTLLKRNKQEVLLLENTEEDMKYYEKKKKVATTPQPELVIPSSEDLKAAVAKVSGPTEEDKKAIAAIEQDTEEPTADEYYTWVKASFTPFNKYFNSTEFDCQCKHKECFEQKISKKLVYKLTKMREEIGPIVITSGFRCAAHQRDLRGSLPPGHTATNTSQHELGNAADIVHRDKALLLKTAEKHFLSIGIANTFLHVDTRGGKKRRWDYK